MNNKTLKSTMYDTDTLNVQLLKIIKDKKLLICYSDDNPQESIIVRYGVKPENNEFSSSVELFWEGAKLNLINCITDSEGFLIPTYIILEPDYLIDASALAECFQDYCISPLHYFRNKLEEKENRSYLLLGNLANFFLDELIYSDNTEDVSFNEVFLKSFRQSPFEYTSCTDIENPVDFREFMIRARGLFENIKRVVRDDFNKLNIDKDYSTLEPSFFSAKYGVQGRLDLLHVYPDSANAKIIELKSGRLPYPANNPTQITLNHVVQTYVYRLMVDSVFGTDNYKVEASILYASSDTPGENIRAASLNGELEKAILNLRNHIIINEHNINTGGVDYVADIFKTLFNHIKTPERIPIFYINKINSIESVLHKSSAIERLYFYRYIQFISKELYHQKIGDIEYETPTGMASLWNTKFEERAEALEVLYDLSIREIDDIGNDMTIIFDRNGRSSEFSSSNEIVNFRDGEICIVYPREDDNDTVLNKQILKGTIVKITAGEVIVRFRYKQRNSHFFENNRLWAIEHDSLDTSYNSMYKGLYAFIKSSAEKKELLLGIRPAEKANKSSYPDISSKFYTGNNFDSSYKNSIELYPENVINMALTARDYFLIVGPPGTGKTSIFARRLIEEYYRNPNINIMVIAYTNRAVDELCGAINAAFECSAGECDAFIRIGSELSCEEKYRHRLLQRVSEKFTDRESIRKEIDKTRIFVSTLASITGKMEIFSLKKFDVSIIDEASQILEPQIIGLLPRFEKFILIGDHNQLSTIVMQEEKESLIEEQELSDIGITDCRDSFFERLLRRCISQGWTHSYTQLNKQGRMHEDIAAFPSAHFYENNLFTALEWQKENWNLNSSSDEPIEYIVSKHRAALFSTERLVHDNHSNKVNEAEAETVVSILKALQKVYHENGKEFRSSSVGIIAPYRNQIALIRHKLSESEIPAFESVMIDTVERFQGSQRDIIIVSFCINRYEQFKFLCNLNHDATVDRKLNVALTRARQQLFLIGNADFLSRHPIYNSLVSSYKDRIYIIED